MNVARSRWGIRRAVPVAIALGASVLLAACGTGPATPAVPTPAATPLGPPATLPPPATSGPTSPSAPPSGSAAASAGTVVRDDSLLSILPADIDGTPVTVEEGSFAEAARDPAFATNVDRAAFAIVTTPTDLASGVVAQLREGVFGSAFFSDWRDTYNEGACAQAGGVATNAETQLGGRTVYITRCAGGLTVYHAAIPERNVVVSLFALGEGRYGERLMAGLRP